MARTFRFPQRPSWTLRWLNPLRRPFSPARSLSLRPGYLYSLLKHPSPKKSFRVSSLFLRRTCAPDLDNPYRLSGRSAGKTVDAWEGPGRLNRYDLTRYRRGPCCYISREVHRLVQGRTVRRVHCCRDWGDLNPPDIPIPSEKYCKLTTSLEIVFG